MSRHLDYKGLSLEPTSTFPILGSNEKIVTIIILLFFFIKKEHKVTSRTLFDVT